MDDVHSFHTRSYEKADYEEPTPMRRTLVILSVLPSLIVKTLFVVGAEIYFLLETIFHYFVPKTLKDIRGQLAAVSEKWFPSRVKYVQWHWHLTSIYNLYHIGNWRQQRHRTGNLLGICAQWL